MYTAHFKYMDGKQQTVKTKKFICKTFAMMWVDAMKKKFPVYVAQVKGKRFYYCAM